MTAALRNGAVPRRFIVKPAPQREPPFDDEFAPPRLSLVGPHDLPLPFDRDSAAVARRQAVRADSFDAEPTSRTDLPAVRPFARQLVIGIIETATGRRSAAQLRWHTSAGVQAGLARDAGRTNRLGTATRPARLHSLHLAEPADGVAEVAAVLQLDQRFRAIAFRLEGLDGRWRCVRLQIG